MLINSLPFLNAQIQLKYSNPRSFLSGDSKRIGADGPLKFPFIRAQMTLCANDPQKNSFTQAAGDQWIYLPADTLGNTLDADGPIYLMPIPSSESKRMGADGPVRLLFTYAEIPAPCSALEKMLDTRAARVCPRKHFAHGWRPRRSRKSNSA